MVAGNRHAGEAAGRGLMTDMGIVRATRHKRRLAGRALARPALRHPAPALKNPGRNRGRERDEAQAKMKKAELEELKDKVHCAAVLERAGFALDVKESTRER
ncbi:MULTISPECIES: hypothetical protein [unclassified Mesorhizobium]|uniref:hypothetical protein n=1 Tax=unclassified Mesorhizobium TaxID=325217 RepID=UPI00333BB6C9